MTTHPQITDTQTLGLQAKQASALMAKAPAATRNAALRSLAKLLRANVDALQTRQRQRP
jgi:glutamate-5-semialdehyde dehydrogenase